MVDTQIHPRVQTRYTRAVNLPRDFRPGGLGISGYQATPLVLQTLGRVMASLRGEVPGRAFSILGPYGAGKSAFGVFLSTFASYSPQARASVLAAHCATSYDPTLLNGPTLLPILIGGNNSSLRPTIMHALFATLHANVLMRQQQPALLAALDAAQHNIEVTPQEVAAWVEHANQAVVDAKAADGMLLMVDELGQYLNHAARHGDERDLFVLQALAEAAKVSRGV